MAASCIPLLTIKTKEMETIDELMTSVMYQDALKEIKEKAHIGISDYDSADFHLKNMTEEDLKKAKLSISLVSDYIQNHLKAIIEYSIRKITYYEQNPNKAESEQYPEGEELADDEKSVVIERHGYVPFILIDYGIEYFFLKEQPDKLLEYIKKVRIPNASKYKREITSLYKQVNNNQLNS